MTSRTRVACLYSLSNDAIAARALATRDATSTTWVVTSRVCRRRSVALPSAASRSRTPGTPGFGTRRVSTAEGTTDRPTGSVRLSESTRPPAASAMRSALSATASTVVPRGTATESDPVMISDGATALTSVRSFAVALLAPKDVSLRPTALPAPPFADPPAAADGRCGASSGADADDPPLLPVHAASGSRPVRTSAVARIVRLRRIAASREGRTGSTRPRCTGRRGPLHRWRPDPSPTGCRSPRSRRPGSRRAGACRPGRGGAGGGSGGAARRAPGSRRRGRVRGSSSCRG